MEVRAAETVAGGRRILAAGGAVSRSGAYAYHAGVHAVDEVVGRGETIRSDGIVERWVLPDRWSCTDSQGVSRPDDRSGRTRDGDWSRSMTNHDTDMPDVPSAEPIADWKRFWSGGD